MPVSFKEQQDSSEGKIAEKKLLKSLKSMQDYKSPEIDGLPIELYESWNSCT